MHHGVDVACPVGTPLIAGADGVIAHKGAGASGGYTLLIRHAGNWHSVYYHLKKPAFKNIGEPVKVGEVVALSGNTGASTGPHLHFELRRSRTFGNTVDPEPYLMGPYREPVRPSRPSRVGRSSPGLEAYGRYMERFGNHWLKKLGRR